MAAVEVNGSQGEPRKFYVSTACLEGTEPLEKRIEKYRDAELDFIELGAGVTLSRGWERVLQLGKHLVHNYFPPPDEPFVLNLASPCVKVREKSQNLAFEAISLSAALEAPFYSLHAGFLSDPVGWSDGSFTFSEPSAGEAERALDRFATALQPIAVYAKQAGVQILIENNVCPPSLKGKLLLQTPLEFEEFFEAYGFEDVGILLDTGHLNVTASTYQFAPIDFLSRLHPRIGGVHLHTNDGTSDQHLPVDDATWIMPELRTRLHAVPLIVEARFSSVAAIVDHVNRLEASTSRGEVR